MPDVENMIRRLIAFEPEFYEALRTWIESTDFGPVLAVAEKYRQLKKETLLELKLESASVEMPEDAQRDVRKALQHLSEHQRLPWEDAMAAVIGRTEFAGNLLSLLEGDDLTPEDYDDLGSAYFYSWFSHYEYIDGLLDAGVLIAREDGLPSELDGFLWEMRTCYAFQQYLAVCILCRASLEIALRHLCELEGFFDPEDERYGITQSYFAEKARRRKWRQREVEDYTKEPSDLRALLKRVPEFSRFDERIGSLYADLSRFVHGSRGANKQVARAVMVDVLSLLHDLYEV